MNKELLKELTGIFGISGREEEVKKYIETKGSGYADEVICDALGNLIFLKKGTGENKKRIMCAAHMDEIGVCVFGITEKGYLRIRTVGGIGAKLLQNTRVEFRNGVQGIITTSEEGFDSSTKLDSYYIDIGASSREDARKQINIGDMAVFVGEYKELLNDNVTAKAIDNRSGCFVLLEAMRQMETPYHDIYFVFTVQEEVGLIGAGTAAERIRPNLGIAVDITGEFDTPGAQEGNMLLGKGAAIKVMDASVICDEDMIQLMCECAESKKIPYQMEVLINGGTDAGPMKRAAFGAKAAGISIPTRYGHGPNGVCNLKDLDACAALLKEILIKKI